MANEDALARVLVTTCSKEVRKEVIERYVGSPFCHLLAEGDIAFSLPEAQVKSVFSDLSFHYPNSSIHVTVSYPCEQYQFDYAHMFLNGQRFTYDVGYHYQVDVYQPIQFFTLCDELALLFSDVKEKVIAFCQALDVKQVNGLFTTDDDVVRINDQVLELHIPMGDRQCLAYKQGGYVVVKDLF